MLYTIPNHLDSIYDLEAEILSEIERAGYDENSRFAIRLALDEALINAFKHGNCQEPGRQVRVRFEVRDDELEFEVEDEGSGFEKDALLDPRMGDGLQKTSGRGIFLIRQFMTSLAFNDRGNSIRFTYERKPDLGVNAHGLAHWKFESAEVLELDPVRIERHPAIVRESIQGLLDGGARRIIVDLKFVENLTHPVCRSLAEAADMARKRGVPLILIRAQPELEDAVCSLCQSSPLRAFPDLRSGIECLENPLN
jgi:serine/threonine-protein kinase RsbW